MDAMAEEAYAHEQSLLRDQHVEEDAPAQCQAAGYVPPPPPPPPPPPQPEVEAVEEAEEASLDAGQQLAFSIAVGGANLFLTGGPGTGKSFTLRKIIGALKERHGASGVLVTAPTGVAALIAEGQTLHSKRGSMSNAEGVVVLAGVGARHRSPPPQSRPIRYFAHHAHPIHTLSTPCPHAGPARACRTARRRPSATCAARPPQSSGARCAAWSLMRSRWSTPSSSTGTAAQSAYPLSARARFLPPPRGTPGGSGRLTTPRSLRQPPPASASLRLGCSS